MVSLLSPSALLCIGFLLVGDLLVLRYALTLTPYQMLAAIGLLVGQSSLAILWAATSRGQALVRYALPVVVVLLSFLVLARLAPWELRDEESAAWVIALVLQGLAIVTLVKAKHVWGRKAGRLRFDLGTLMLWTAVIAVVFGSFQFGRVHWGWDINAAARRYVAVITIFGLATAVVAVAWAWAFDAATARWQAARLATATVLVALVTALFSWSLNRVQGDTPMTIEESSIFLGMQSLVVIAALVITARARQSPRMSEPTHG